MELCGLIGFGMIVWMIVKMAKGVKGGLADARRDNQIMRVEARRVEMPHVEIPPTIHGEPPRSFKRIAAEAAGKTAGQIFARALLNVIARALGGR